MSVINRTSLKAEFATGNRATSSYFEDLIDSAFNKAEDSVILGPVGITGKSGLIGPTGSTHNGLIGPSGATFYTGFYLIGTTPGATNSPGSIGQVAFNNNVGSTSVDMYIHNGSQWFKFSGTNTF